MRNKEGENYICSEHIRMVLMDREERQRDQQPFIGFEQENPLAEVAFWEKCVLLS